MKYRALAGIGLLAVAAWGLHLATQAPQRDPPDRPATATAAAALSVTVTTVARSDLPLAIEASGRVEARNSVPVKAQVDGQVAAIGFDEGRPVRQGQLLFRLDASVAQAQLRQAEAVLARDQAQLARVRSDAARSRTLAGQGFISPSGLSQTEADMKSAQATLAADRAARDSARLLLGHCRITAPMDGVAGAALVPLGGATRANDTTLVVINQMRPIYVSFALPESQLAALKAAMARGPVPVSAQIGGDERAVAGRLAFIDNAVDASSGSITAKALFDNGDGFLTPGQFAHVRIQVGVLSQTLSVPDQAVESGIDGRYVFVVGVDGAVAIRRVTEGPSSGGRTVVTAGLAVGERVVTSGQARLRDKDRVAIAARAPAEDGW